MGLDGLVFEEVDDFFGAHADGGHQVLGRGLFAVLASDKDSCARAQGTCHDGVLGCELDDIGHADVEQLGPDKSL